MLIFNLISELRDAREQDDWLRIQPGEPVKRLINRYYLMLQLAIELVLLDPIVRERVQQDPNFEQIMYDALYYPTRMWFQGKEDLDISREAIIDSISDLGEGSLMLEENETDLLYSTVRRVITLVSNPERLKKEVLRPPGFGVGADVCEAIPLKPALLVRVAEDRYKWRYDRFGVPFQKAKVTEVLTAELDEAEQFIDRMERLLGLRAMLATDLPTVPLDQAGEVIEFFSAFLQKASIPETPVQAEQPRSGVDPRPSAEGSAAG
jgi:hypothetical protein